MAIALDRGPRMQSLELGLGPVKPLHEAFDPTGHLWVTLANSDQMVRMSPTPGALSAPAPEVFPLPGGIHDPANPPRASGTVVAGGVLGPGEVAVDGRGIVWVTLGLENAIARIDPAKTIADTTNGITVYPLKPCTATNCRTPPAGGPAAPLSRVPLQLRLYEDGGGNTVMFFTEQLADAIGVLRVSSDGVKLDETHLSCDCVQPLGVALDPSGDVWFSEGSSNRLGRLTLDQSRPYAAAARRIRHYVVPNPVVDFVPGRAPLACGEPGLPACPPGVLPNPFVTAF